MASSCEVTDFVDAGWEKAVSIYHGIWSSTEVINLMLNLSQYAGFLFLFVFVFLLMLLPQMTSTL